MVALANIWNGTEWKDMATAKIWNGTEWKDLCPGATTIPPGSITLECPVITRVYVQIEGATTIDWGDGSAPTNAASGALTSHNLVTAPVTVVITPQAGNTITSCIFVYTAAVNNIRGITFDTPDLTYVNWGGTAGDLMLNLEYVDFVSQVTFDSCDTLFAGLSRLTSVTGGPVISNDNIYSQMFYNNSDLFTLPEFNTALGTDFSSMFAGCASLLTIPALNVATGTNFSGMVSGCTSLTSSLMTGGKYAISYNTSPGLDTAALNTIFTNLGTAAGAQTINITGCAGAATCDRTIATNKGWTVTG